MSKPSESELRLLRPLWRAQRLSSREIHDAAGGDAVWSYSATRKTLDRMAEKGLVRIEVVHGVKTYAALAPKLETLAGAIRDFARNVLDAPVRIPAATFIGSKVIEPDEVEELEGLLARLEAEDDAAAPAGDGEEGEGNEPAS